MSTKKTTSKKGPEKASAESMSGSVERKSDVLDAVKSIEEAQGTVNVIYGPHDLDMEFQDVTVAEAQEALKDVLSVDATAEAYIDGKLVEDKGTRLKAGQRLEFMKQAGQKGVSP